jgi:hypothetical protein
MNVGPGITAEFPILTDEQEHATTPRRARCCTPLVTGATTSSSSKRGGRRPATGDAERPRGPDRNLGPGRFLGELNLLTG